MPDCECLAIPKTSVNGIPFFAHYSDECTSAPETKWHLDAKELVVLSLGNMGIPCERKKAEYRSAGAGSLIFTSPTAGVRIVVGFSIPIRRSRNISYAKGAVVSAASNAIG